MNKQKAKEKAKERDGWECQFCGMDNDTHKDEFDRALHAHHIVKDADGGEDHPRNLITVCRDCHSTLESTQADALSRIKEKQADEETIENLKEQIKAKENEIESIRDGLYDEGEVGTAVLDTLADMNFDYHFVMERYGTRSDVYRDTEFGRNAAFRRYKEWGNTIESYSMPIKEDKTKEIAEDVTDKLLDPDYKLTGVGNRKKRNPEYYDE